MVKRASRTHASASQSRRYQVFLSHATADKYLAKVLCEKIEKTGAKTFRDDRDIDGGDDIPEKIRREIIHSKELLVLLTPESIKRIWVQLEIGAAWGRGKRIIAVLCHVPVSKIPDSFKAKKVVPINEFESSVGELKKRLKKA